VHVAKRSEVFYHTVNHAAAGCCGAWVTQVDLSFMNRLGLHSCAHRASACQKHTLYIRLALLRSAARAPLR
jgi:hypothetical protein